ncbi:hypothetical protein [Undibacterium sp. Ji67W]|uniref:hypothetical protein n=1 Tax=Undibacterium sp. Ji67W TaxID=3413042 RepID=UPI003BF5305B
MKTTVSIDCYFSAFSSFSFFIVVFVVTNGWFDVWIKQKACFPMTVAGLSNTLIER